MEATEDVPAELLYEPDVVIEGDKSTEAKERTVTLSQDENGYYLELDDPFTREALDAGADSIFCLIEVSYTVDGNKYVSVSAFNELSAEAGF